MKIAIIGAGITGLSAAYDLVQAGYDVTIFEASTQIGGLAAGFQSPGWAWSLESYYHHLFTGDRAILDLVQELGLSDQVIFSRPRTVSPFKDRFYPLDSPAAIVRFPGLSLADKARMGAVTAYLKYLSPWQPLEQVTAETWLTRAYGQTIFRQIWAPLLSGKFGAYADKVNMAWMWARLKARTSSLGTFQGGFQTFIHGLGSRLEELGVKIKTTTAIREVTPAPRHHWLVNIDNRPQPFDQVLLTLAPHLALKLVPSMPAPYSTRLSALIHLGAIAVVLALNEPLSPEGYYWYNLEKTAKRPYLALVEHTNFVSSRHYGGDHLIYIGDYTDPSDRRFNATKAELVHSCLPVLTLINPAFKPGWVRKSWVNRTKYAQPVPLINHSRKLPAIKTPLPGLFLANMSQVYPWDRGTNYAVELGRRAARIISRHS